MLNETKKTKSVSQKLTDFENACRKANLKVTHQRVEIFRKLTEAHDHPSAETLYKRLQKKLPTLSLDTIYRTLATFEKHGLISRVETMKSQARFEAEMGEHHHIICKALYTEITRLLAFVCLPVIETIECVHTTFAVVVVL